MSVVQIEYIVHMQFAASCESSSSHVTFRDENRWWRIKLRTLPIFRFISGLFAEMFGGNYFFGDSAPHFYPSHRQPFSLPSPLSTVASRYTDAASVFIRLGVSADKSNATNT